MREKFTRSTEHVKVDDIKTEHSAEQTKANLEILKSAVQKMKTESAIKKADSEYVNLEDIKVAMVEECPDIDINNAHKKYR